LEIDPEFAEASAGLATAYWIIGDQLWLPAREAFEHARQAAENAIRLNPKLGVAHAALAEVHLLYDWDWAGADSEANLALSLGAGVEGAKAAARVAATFGRWDRARQLIKSGLAIDPFDPMLHMNLAYVVDLRSGRFAEAAAETKRTLDLSPEYGSARYYHGVALLLQGRLEEALATMQQVKVDDSGPEGLAIVYFALGRKAESDAALQRAIAQDGDWPYGIATTLAFRHETDKAISWLERAYAQRDSDMYTIKGEPLFRSIENDS
jgi:tetratricopeptide (TPR) repeat protein